MDGGGYGDAAAFAVGWAVQPLPHPNPIHSSTLEEKRDRDAAAAARASERGLAVALGCGGRGRVHTASPPLFRSYRHWLNTVTKDSMNSNI